MAGELETGSPGYDIKTAPGEGLEKVEGKSHHLPEVTKEPHSFPDS